VFQSVDEGDAEELDEAREPVDSAPEMDPDGFPLPSDDAPAAQPTRRTQLHIPDVCNIAPLQSLRVTDADFVEDFQAWLLCPEGSQTSPCTIQLKCTRVVWVLDVRGAVRLAVKQLKCAQHSRSFLLTSPHAFQQLWEKGLHFEPEIRVITGRTVVTAAAFR
jgi:hypothetical protein